MNRRNVGSSRLAPSQSRRNLAGKVKQSRVITFRNSSGYHYAYARGGSAKRVMACEYRYEHHPIENAGFLLDT